MSEWLRFALITSRTAAEYGVGVGWIGALALMLPYWRSPSCSACPWVGRSIASWLAAQPAHVAALLMAVGAEIRHLGGYPWVLTGQILFALAQPLLANSVGKMAIIWFDGPG